MLVYLLKSYFGKLIVVVLELVFVGGCYVLVLIVLIWFEVIGLGLVNGNDDGVLFGLM